MGAHFSGSGYIETSGSGTITALNGAASLNVPASSTAIFVISGTWSATLTFEASVDGTTFFSVPAILIGSSTIGSTTTANGAYGIAVGGYYAVRVRASSYTSGTATVIYNADSNNNYGATPPAIGTSTNPLQIAGTVNAAITAGGKPTYSAAFQGTSIGLLATDVFTITGSATRVIRVTRMNVEFTGGGFAVQVTFLKRSTANSGGTSTVVTAVPNDSTDAAATGVVRQYTVNPTTGTLVGAIDQGRVNSPLTSSATAPTPFEWFASRPAKEIILRGTNEVAAINLAGVTLSSASFAGTVEWTEDTI